MVSCKLYRSPCFGKSLRFLAESFNSPVFTAFSSSLSRERDSWEFWQKGCIFITIRGLLTPLLYLSRISIISLVSPWNFTYLYDPWDRVSTALGGFGFGFTTASLVNIPITSLSLSCCNYHWIFTRRRVFKMCMCCCLKGPYLIKMTARQGRLVMTGHNLPHAVPVRKFYGTYIEDVKNSTGHTLSTFMKSNFRCLRAFLSRENQVEELRQDLELKSYIKDIQAVNHYTCIQGSVSYYDRDI